MVYNKLVRDKIPEKIKNNGEICKFHVATDDEFVIKLHEKLLEEINELLSNPSAEEYADVQEVLDCFRKLHNLKLVDIRDFGIYKRCKNGRFDGRIILDFTE